MTCPTSPHASPSPPRLSSPCESPQNANKTRNVTPCLSFTTSSQPSSLPSECPPTPSSYAPCLPYLTSPPSTLKALSGLFPSDCSWVFQSSEELSLPHHPSYGLQCHRCSLFCLQRRRACSELRGSVAPVEGLSPAALQLPDVGGRGAHITVQRPRPPPRDGSRSGVLRGRRHSQRM